MADLGVDVSLGVALSEIEKKVGQAEVYRDYLKTNLSNKGVDVSRLTKMGELISGINRIDTGLKTIEGVIPLWGDTPFGVGIGEDNAPSGTKSVRDEKYTLNTLVQEKTFVFPKKSQIFTFHGMLYNGLYASTVEAKIEVNSRVVFNTPRINPKKRLNITNSIELKYGDELKLSIIGRKINSGESNGTSSFHINKIEIGLKDQNGEVLFFKE